MPRLCSPFGTTAIYYTDIHVYELSESIDVLAFLTKPIVGAAIKRSSSHWGQTGCDYYTSGRTEANKVLRFAHMVGKSRSSVTQHSILGQSFMRRDRPENYFLSEIYQYRRSLWSSGQNSWLLTQRSQVRFPVLSDFLSRSGSGTGSTQPLWG
jgi:hypothetical protein